jgi:hypothetical protein
VSIARQKRTTRSAETAVYEHSRQEESMQGEILESSSICEHGRSGRNYRSAGGAVIYVSMVGGRSQCKECRGAVYVSMEPEKLLQGVRRSSGYVSMQTEKLTTRSAEE